MSDLITLLGILTGFVSVLGAALWAIAGLTGGSGQEKRSRH